RNTGAAVPDGGFFTSDQLKKRNEEEPLFGRHSPSRGRMEVKPPGDGLSDVSGTQEGRYYFFFQAEDRIRDLTVTGVQTCALPIYPRRAAPPRSASSRPRCRPPRALPSSPPRCRTIRR